MPLDLARIIAKNLGVKSETKTRAIDQALEGYVRLVPQSASIEAGATLPATALDLTITTVTSTSYTVDADDDIILVDDDTAGGVVTITLLPSATAPSRRIDIKKIGSTANVIVDGDGTETIDGGLTATLTVKDETFTVAPDGSNWHIVG